jgi:hypothetical protein
MSDIANRDQIDELPARQAITDQLAVYCRGMDRIDVDLARSVFHPDAVADYGAMFRGSGYEFVQFHAEVHPAMETHVHHLGSISITVDGDHAGSETYVLARLRSRNAEGELSDTISHGRYVDRWERRQGIWRISHRRYLHAMDDTRPVVGAVFATDGTRDRTDPSYAALADPAAHDAVR